MAKRKRRSRKTSRRRVSGIGAALNLYFSIPAGLLAGAGLKQALVKAGVVTGYQATPVIAGYQATPVIAGMPIGGMPPALSGYRVNGMPPALSGYRVNGDSKVMAGMGSTNPGSGYMG